MGKKEEKGFLSLMNLNGKYAIQMKSINNKRTFFVAELEHTKKEGKGENEKATPLTLKLTPATLSFAKVETKGKPIMFKELVE